MPDIANNKEMVPLEHYLKRFALLDPNEASGRTGIRFDAANGAFDVRLLSVRYRVFHPDFRIEADDPSALALESIPAQIYILRYLLEGKAVQGNGNFLTYREMPWGDVYLTPFTGRCLKRAAFSFGTRLDDFKAACEKLMLIPVKYGDAAYQAEILPGYDVRMIVWEGDDEFPPNAQILFSDNFAEAFAVEDRTVTADLIITEIKRNM